MNTNASETSAEPVSNLQNQSQNNILLLKNEDGNSQGEDNLGKEKGLEEKLKAKKIYLTDSIFGNPESEIFLKFVVKNQNRDSIISILLDDSDYGENQIFSTTASINKINYIDTDYLSEENLYISTVDITLRKSKSSKRVIKIKDMEFLRAGIALLGKVDINNSKSNTISIDSSSCVESDSRYFIFNEFDDYVHVSGLKSVSLLPKVLSIPSIYNGKVVNYIGSHALAKCTSEIVILPATIKGIDVNIFLDAIMIKSLVLLNEEPWATSKVNWSLALSNDQLDGSCQIFVPAGMYDWYIARETMEHGMWYFYSRLVQKLSSFKFSVK